MKNRITDTEAEVKAKVRRWLKTKRPGTKFISYSPYPHGETGTPDLLGCIKGHFVAIEVKKKGGVLKPLQKIRQAEWKAAGATTMVIYSLDDLKNNLKEFYDG